MSKLGIKLNLMRLKNAALITVKGKTATKRGVFIPLDDNDIFEGESGAYLSLVAFEANLSDGKTHIVKRSIKREDVEAMTEEQRKSIPIVGDIKPFGMSATAANPEGLEIETSEGSDDLPF